MKDYGLRAAILGVLIFLNILVAIVAVGQNGIIFTLACLGIISGGFSFRENWREWRKQQ